MKQNLYMQNEHLKQREYYHPNVILRNAVGHDLLTLLHNNSKHTVHIRFVLYLLFKAFIKCSCKTQCEYTKRDLIACSKERLEMHTESEKGNGIITPNRWHSKIPKQATNAGLKPIGTVFPDCKLLTIGDNLQAKRCF